MLDLIGSIVIVIGVIFVSIGVIGIYRFNNFYARALAASKVDTVGFITIILGVILKSGFNFFTLKVIVILIVNMLINPMITHSIVRSAKISGYKIGKE
ncbi:monovalent cation/H(+) antiporter subunit G [Fusibacter bizertensis]|jgi:Multisubunit Na+/H+ antiporter, MnhG subunit|uniref:Monovalent cation/H(+) antiporter subunit G n=1 Tax=Fusibacter bizertensis TaxID=1488331 RepID=A0ABT6NBJ7_9FIRM|nr:monovalent cation/H(+) antiporter subunit G [Fusibacter bizertensis]MDH8677755.1 monovalent cation/H(+) antiporter subunit G [Fusibacter bizertensis]